MEYNFDLETAIIQLEDVEILFEMFRVTFADFRDWKSLNKNRLEKMEHAFHVLWDMYTAKKEAVEREYYGEGGKKGSA